MAKKKSGRAKAPAGSGRKSGRKSGRAKGGGRSSRRKAPAKGRKKAEAGPEEPSQHYIVCGVGGIGRYVAHDLHRRGRSYLVIERDPAQVEAMERSLGHALPHLVGDASDDDVLAGAGVTRARGLITTFDNDKMNVFVTLSARRLNPKLRIVSRAADEETVAKLRRAGADSVVSTNFIGGMRVASEMVRPHVVSFLDIVLKDQERPIKIEEVRVGASSPLAGRRLSDPRLSEERNLLVVALCGASDDEYVFHPPAERVVQPGDTLVVMGRVDEIAALQDLAAGEENAA